MAIKRIKVSNFKTFKDLDLELGQFNVVIGANASGKSNFTQIFKFLKDIEENDLQDAISMSGGLDSLRNLRLGASTNLAMDVVSDRRFGWSAGSRGLQIDEVTYDFSLKFDQPKNGYTIAADNLTQKFKIVRLEEEQKPLFELGVGGGSITISNVDGKFAYCFRPQEIEDQLKEMEIAPFFSFLPSLSGREIPPLDLLIQTQYRLMPPWETLFEGLAVYDIDPHIAKAPVQITGRAELHANAENLALVLDNIIQDKEKKRKFCNLVKDLLPFVEDVDTERFAKSLLMRLQENYYENRFLRAYMLSDGTINITALLIALYFEQKDVIILEEPERNIHPRLVSGILDMMKDASKHKQIIVTTHSPEVVKHAGLENLLLVSRDKDGFSTVSRPSERQQVKVFMDNDLGLDELFIDDLLGD